MWSILFNYNSLFIYFNFYFFSIKPAFEMRKGVKN